MTLGQSETTAREAVKAIPEVISFGSERQRNYYHSMQERYEFILKRVLDEQSGARILELGADPYHLPVAYQQLGYEVVGLDLDPDRGSEIINQQDLDVRKCDVNREEFPVESDSVDMVVFSEVFEHLFHPIHALLEINRVLHSDGTLLLTTPNLYRLGNLVRFLSGKGFDNAYRQWEKIKEIGHMGHVRQYARPQVVEFIENTGFQVQESECIAFSGSSHRLAPIINVVYRAVPFTRPFQYALATPECT